MPLLTAKLVAGSPCALLLASCSAALTDLLVQDHQAAA